MQAGIVKITQQIQEIDDFTSCNIIGDPGCDGLGAGTMSIFATALTAHPADFSIIVGDLVPVGIKKLYTDIETFINSIATHPVYSLCGNHDTDYYEEYFGYKDYALYNNKNLLIFLDNSARQFSEATIDFLQNLLAEYNRQSICVFFHIPPPNSLSKNSVSQEEWSKVSSVLSHCKDNVKAIICGHVHSYFEDTVDGIPLIVTGGGGARIEFVCDKKNQKKAYHHILNITCENDLTVNHISLVEKKYQKELDFDNIQGFLEQSYHNESAAHVRYKIFAEHAKNKGLDGLSKLFDALSDAEYYHAKNYYLMLHELQSIKTTITNSKSNESFEVNDLYKSYIEYCEKYDLGLTKYSFFDAREAEIVHEKLLTTALEYYNKGEDMPINNYYTCTSCGYTFHNEKSPGRCPICGAPKDKIKEVN